MTIIDLKDDIIKHAVKNFYIFTGTEIGIMNIYLNQMSKVVGMPITRLDTVASALSKCRSKSLFGNTNGLYVVRGDADFTKQEKVYQSLQQTLSNNNYLILIYDKIDSRLKFGKFFKDSIVEFEKLSNSILSKYIAKASGMSDKNSSELGELCQNCYDSSMLEVDKIKQYSKSSGLSADKSFEKLLQEKQIYQPQTTDVFQFADAVLSRNIRKVFSVYSVLQENYVSSINILGTLYNSMKTVLLIQCCDRNENISEVTGLDNRQIYFNKKYVGKYKTDKLVFDIEKILDIINGIKEGKIEDNYAVKYALVYIL